MVDWGGLLFEVASIVFLAVASMAMQALFSYLKKKGIIEAIMVKTELAAIAVQFIEQVYIDADGQEKFDAAIEYLADALNKNGIKVTAAELEGLIESAVYEMNQIWAAVTDE
jgi:LL-H family phage holin